MRKIVLALSWIGCSVVLAQTPPDSKDQVQGAEQTWKGTLVDGACNTAPLKAAPPKETQKVPSGGVGKEIADACRITAASTSFALVPFDGRIVKFDGKGNAQVLEAMQHKSTRKADKKQAGIPAVTVVGVMEGDLLIVHSVQLQ
jgi:hypothetical protein